MFISRKRFEEMERKLMWLDLQYNYLFDIFHGLVKYVDKNNKPQSAQTDLLGSVTLQDLASLLIDNKSIVREDNVKIRKEFNLK